MPSQLPQSVLNQIKQAAKDSFEQTTEQAKQIVDTGIEQLGIKTRPLSQAKLLFGNKTSDQSSQSGTIPEKDKNDFKGKVQFSRLQKELSVEIAKAQQQRTRELQQRRESKKETNQIKIQTGQVESQKQMTPTIETHAPKKGMLGGAPNRRVKSAQQQSQAETAGQRTSG